MLPNSWLELGFGLVGYLGVLGCLEYFWMVGVDSAVIVVPMVFGLGILAMVNCSWSVGLVVVGVASVFGSDIVVLLQ